MAAAQSPAALVAPCIERILHGATGRKHAKLRQDAQALLDKLDTLLVVQTAVPVAAPPQQPAPVSPAAATAATAAAEAAEPPVEQPAAAPAPPAPAEEIEAVVDEEEEQVEVSLQESQDGQVAFKLSLSPSKQAALPAAAAPAAGAAEHEPDPGHMPVSPSSATGGGAPRPAGMRQHIELRPGALHDGAARELMCFLRDVVDTRKPPLMEQALDCTQKLVSFKLLQGPVHHINHRRDSTKKRGEEGEEEGGAGLDFDALPPQAQAVELACRCDDVSDDGVELRLLKALLTAVTSTTLAVHGQALLLVVRACYNIFLTSRSDVNQATAKATLTQMLNVVFQRMEAGSTHVVVPPIVVSDVLGLPPADASNMSAFVQQFLADVVAAVDPFGTVAQEIQQGLDDAFVAQTPILDAYPEDLYDPSDPTDRQQIEWRAGSQGAQQGSQQQGVGEAAAAAEQVAGGGPEQQAVASPAAAAVPEGMGSPPQRCSSTAGDAVGGYAHSATSDHTSTAHGGEAAGGGAAKQLSMPAQLQKDAFLVFRALCKLSIRSTDSAPGSEVTTIRGKVLALELLKVLLENSGPQFRNGERFVSAIKQYLCLSLLKNCQSAVPAALRLCCSIFLTLMAKFRKSLKAEIGVFFPMILLRPIEPPVTGATPNAPGAGGAATAPVDIAHKAVVLRCLQAQCEDGQLLVDLFVNYDCDLEGANLFERMVTALVRISQGSLAHEQGATQTPLEEQAIRYEALRCLVSILKSLAAWHSTQTTAAAAAAAEGAAAAALAEGGVAAGGEAVAPSAAGNGGPAAVEEALVAADESVMQSGWMAKLEEGGLVPSGTSASDTGEGDQRQAALLESWKGYKRQFQQGVMLFNQKPKKGVAFMQEQGVVGTSPAEVAQFLARTQGLNKTLIGDYLGERDEFNLRVMHCYVDALEFTEMDFDAAIRAFLSGFRLPGEAQKIDRLMEKFAERYVCCNPDSFKSADVAYVLAYSVIMLNTDAHNAQVKVKMSKADFLRNNRGINDGGDLPQAFMEALYDRIISNEIKMKDEGLLGPGAQQQAGAGAASAGWLDTIMNLLPGRAKAASAEPNDEAIRRTHEHLREKAKGMTFFEAHDSEAVRPMLDVSWAPLLGAFSVLFEEHDDEYFVGLCLEGFISSVWLTSLLDVSMLRNTFVTSLARFTMLHSPASMRLKHARAFRALLVVAEQNGNHLRECWTEVLRCVSRFELLQQLTAGVPTDALLFAMPDKAAAGGGSSAGAKLKQRILRGRGKGDHHGEEGLAHDSFSSINDMGLHMGTREVDKKHLPPAEVMASVDVQELNRLFVNSGRLDSEAIVQFVKTLSAIAAEELRPVACPRVFSLAKIVEIAHFNMGRIRLVWSRIWAVLADFFIEVGCHANLAVAMYAVDSLRQLAMKFLERDELANFSFQNDFLRPFVVVMRHSRAVEIRELIIRCVSQMVLARAASVKSGWKSMFMVFTTAAADENPQIVRLAFDTVEKIVREHFHYITETETTTFTDCVNCLIAFTNNPHSLDVSLNAIAFLRFCALALAEGDIGDVEELPEGSLEAAGRQMDPNAFRIRPKGQDAVSPVRGRSEDDSSSGANGHGEVAASPGGTLRPLGGGRIRFTDKDEHMYFWFPLLAGLSELTFDPRPEIRYSALEVLFDILKFHGASFSPQFWLRVFDSVLLPIFDHVRAEVTDTTTFTDDKRRAEVDSWLYDTCTRTLQHIVDIVVQYYAAVSALLDRIVELLLGFVRRTHLALAGVGVAALVRLIVAAGPQMDEPTWMMMLGALSTAAGDTMPNVGDLIQHRMTRRTNTDPEFEQPYGASSGGGDTPLREQYGVTSPHAASWGGTPGSSPRGSQQHQQQEGPHGREARPSLFSLGEGAGARRLAEVHVRASIQLLLVQACSEVYTQHSRTMPAPAAVALLDILRGIASHAAVVDADAGLRHSLLLAQAADKVPADRALGDPPLLRLEAEASQAYLSALLHVQAAAPEPVRAACALEARLTQLCLRNLERFEQQEELAEAEAGGGEADALAGSRREENAALAPLAVATLRALLAFPPDAFRAHLKDFFPLLTTLISCEYAPPEVQRALSELFAKRIGPMLAT